MEKSYLQLQAEASQFDEDARTKQRNAAPATTHDYPAFGVRRKVDPSHPHADWGGQVPISQSRKHFDEPTGIATSISTSERGLVPKESASTADARLVHRKQFPDDRARVVQSSMLADTSKEATPSTEHWHTEYRSAVCEKDATVTRSRPGGRRHVVPSYEAHMNNPAIRERQAPDRVYSQFGARHAATSRTSANSLMAGLGRDVASRLR